jgi:hypothetical protein
MNALVHRVLDPFVRLGDEIHDAAVVFFHDVDDPIRGPAIEDHVLDVPVPLPANTADRVLDGVGTVEADGDDRDPHRMRIQPRLGGGGTLHDIVPDVGEQPYPAGLLQLHTVEPRTFAGSDFKRGMKRDCLAVKNTLAHMNEFAGSYFPCVLASDKIHPPTTHRCSLRGRHRQHLVKARK